MTLWTPPFSRSELELPSKKLETMRVILRPVLAGDVSCFWEMDSDPDVMKYVGVPAYTDRVLFEDEFHKNLKEGERFKFLRMIHVKEWNEPVGWLLFRPTEDGKWIEMGWRLVKRAWGFGYVPEAGQKLIEEAFNNWGLKSVMAVLEKPNTNSSRVCEKLGMTYRGETTDYYDVNLSLWAIGEAGE